MRTLSLVDDSPDLASTVDARATFTQARRCVYLSQCYAPVKKFAEALTLLQHASLHIRETKSFLSSVASIEDSKTSFYPLSHEVVAKLEDIASQATIQYKRDWFMLNGGAIDPDQKSSYEKPLFFNIAWNYINVDMDRLHERAGRERASTSVVPAKESKQEEVAEPEPQVTPAASRSGLSSLLGGWWGR